MNKKWSILFCDPNFNPCPASEFIEACKPAHQIKVMHFLELLEESGPTLPRPYADILREGIHELRIKLSGDQVRILYFFCFETFIVLFQALRKHTSAVPEQAITETVRYRTALLSRVDRNELQRQARFGDWLHQRYLEPGFREQYERLCTVCGRTADIVGKMHERSISAADMAERTGIPVEKLMKLETADWCRFEEVRTLCRELGIEEPQSCVKEKYA